jgi:hypothetical protein
MADIDLPRAASNLPADVIFIVVGMLVVALLGAGLVLAVLVHGGAEVYRWFGRELFKTPT